VTEKVATVPLYLVSTDPSSNIETQKLNDYVMVDYGESVNTLHLREFKNAPPAKHFMSQPRVALEYILEAGGCAYLPLQLVVEHIGSKKLYIIEDAPVYSREIYAIYLAKSHKAKVISQAIQYFPEVSL
ncbi:MAG: LysR family transcriptional regulator, partial [Psychromonas sp.]